MINQDITPNVSSESGRLNAVITHFPGHEIEKMTPFSIKEALYSDILNLNIASQEYSLFRKALQAHTQVLEIRTLLAESLENIEAKKEIINEIKDLHQLDNKTVYVLQEMDSSQLATTIIEGYPIEAKENFLITPAYNLFFTRDIAIVHNDFVLIPKMASKIRAKESIIAKIVFKYHPRIKVDASKVLDANNYVGNLKFEGGDIHIFNKDITLIGNGLRTNWEGINFIIKNTSKNKKHTYIVQALPTELESYIHLDMIFTVLSDKECMIYKPVFDNLKYNAFAIEAENGKIISKIETPNLLTALKEKGFDLTHIYCGNDDPLHAPREQWHSGANFFAVDNGKILGYNRNSNTLKALAAHGYEIINAEDIDNYNLNSIEKYVIAFPGNELARGSGGARCMTSPLNRI